MGNLKLLLKQKLPGLSSNNVLVKRISAGLYLSAAAIWVTSVFVLFYSFFFVDSEKNGQAINDLKLRSEKNFKTDKISEFRNIEKNVDITEFSGEKKILMQSPSTENSFVSGDVSPEKKKTVLPAPAQNGSSYKTDSLINFNKIISVPDAGHKTGNIKSEKPVTFQTEIVKPAEIIRIENIKTQSSAKTVKKSKPVKKQVKQVKKIISSKKNIPKKKRKILTQQKNEIVVKTEKNSRDEKVQVISEPLKKTENTVINNNEIFYKPQKKTNSPIPVQLKNFSEKNKLVPDKSVDMSKVLQAGMEEYKNNFNKGLSSENDSLEILSEEKKYSGIKPREIKKYEYEPLK